VYDTVINLSRLLKTNGIIVISTPNAISDKWLKQVRQYGYHKGGKRHIHWYDKQTIEQLFNIFGFELYEIISKDLEPRLIVSFKKVEEINIWEYKTK
jgi:predicted glycosyltransferase